MNRHHQNPKDIKAILRLITQYTIYYYHADKLGSIVSLTDKRERVVQSYIYNPFGKLLHNYRTRVEQPYTYTGREWDKGARLYYYRARYYDPKVGRFITRDPIGFAGGDMNLYGYVGNNPVNWVDPAGLFSEEYASAIGDPWQNLTGPIGPTFKSSEYFDINVNAGMVVGVTFGVMISESGVYPYIGGGLMTPGASVTWSPSRPVPGFTVAAQASLLLALQRGYSFAIGESFWEYGVAWPPGASLTFFFVGDSIVDKSLVCPL